MPRAVVTGGAGFIGSHLCDRLLADGWEVVAVDSLLTGDVANLDAAHASSRFTFIEQDVSAGLRVDGPVDLLAHLACPASPVHYLRFPIETLLVGSDGARNALELAKATGAVFLLSSTSEVYGDPLVHPQPETYWGNVNPIGPRSVYDESKRFSEALVSAYARTFGMPVRIVRIFNTYGPRMAHGDGRAIPTFLAQALRGDPITLHGNGSQTRSLCYVDDLIEGLCRLVASDVEGPVNIGNPEEVTVRELAERVRAAAESGVPIVEVDRPQDDPELRRPDITRARELLGWTPTISLNEGLSRMLEWARASWEIPMEEEPATVRR